MPVWLLKQMMPMSEFRLWQAWMKKEFEQHTKLDYYLAQLATVMQNAWWKKKRKLTDFLLSFARKGPKITVETVADKKARITAEHKAFFGAHLESLGNRHARKRRR